jgi:hypothetical protein
MKRWKFSNQPHRQIFTHKRGNRASIFAASLTHSRGRRNSGSSLSITSFSQFLASMFNMQARSAKDVESMCAMKGSMQMLKKRNNSWTQVGFKAVFVMLVISWYLVSGV